MPRTRMQRPITYRNRQSRVWSASEATRLKVVSPSNDRPDDLADFEERTSRQWDRASLSQLRIAIEQRRRELAG